MVRNSSHQTGLMVGSELFTAQHWDWWSRFMSCMYLCVGRLVVDVELCCQLTGWCPICVEERRTGLGRCQQPRPGGRLCQYRPDHRTAASHWLAWTTQPSTHTQAAVKHTSHTSPPSARGTNISSPLRQLLSLLRYTLCLPLVGSRFTRYYVVSLWLIFYRFSSSFGPEWKLHPHVHTEPCPGEWGKGNIHLFRSSVLWISCKSCI